MGTQMIANAYRSGSVQHADTEVPKADSAIFSNASETVVLVVAAPRVEGDRGHPRMMPLAPSNEGGLRRAPNRDKVILTTREDVFTVGRPTDAQQATVVRIEEIQEPKAMCERSLSWAVFDPSQVQGRGEGSLTPLSSNQLS